MTGRSGLAERPAWALLEVGQAGARRARARAAGHSSANLQSGRMEGTRIRLLYDCTPYSSDVVVEGGGARKP